MLLEVWVGPFGGQSPPPGGQFCACCKRELLVAVTCTCATYDASSITQAARPYTREGLIRH